MDQGPTFLTLPAMLPSPLELITVPACRGERLLHLPLKTSVPNPSPPPPPTPHPASSISSEAWTPLPTKHPSLPLMPPAAPRPTGVSSTFKTAAKTHFQITARTEMWDRCGWRHRLPPALHHCPRGTASPASKDPWPLGQPAPSAPLCSLAPPLPVLFLLHRMPFPHLLTGSPTLHPSRMPSPRPPSAARCQVPCASAQAL